MKRITRTTTTQELTTTQRVSIGMVAISLSMFSLAFGVALFASPGANSLFTVPDVMPVLPPSTASAVTLSWIVPGNNGTMSQPVSYNLRYSTSPITEDTFLSAMPVPLTMMPAPVGARETVTVTGLQPSTTTFFAFTATDAGGQTSTLSDVTAKTTGSLAQACLPAYVCSAWSACAGNQQDRSCSPTNSCQSDLGQPITRQSCTGPLAEPVRIVNDVVAVGTAPGQPPLVRLFSPYAGKFIREISVGQATNTRGLNTATGDLTGDHHVDIVVGTGAGSPPMVTMYKPDGRLVASLNPYPTESNSGVSIAAGDVNGDGIDELITVPSTSTSQVRVWKFDAAENNFSQIAQTLAFERAWLPGFSVAAGDLDNDGRAEILVTPRAEGSSAVILSLSDKKVLQESGSFQAYGTPLAQGMTGAIGDFFGTGRKMIMTAPRSSALTPIKIFTASGLEQNSFLPGGDMTGENVQINSSDVNHDGRDELLIVSAQRGQTGLSIWQYDGLQQRWQRLSQRTIFTRHVMNGLGPERL